jgi:hypothetical protein
MSEKAARLRLRPRARSHFRIHFPGRAGERRAGKKEKKRKLRSNLRAVFSHSPATFKSFSPLSFAIWRLFVTFTPIN